MQDSDEDVREAAAEGVATVADRGHAAAAKAMQRLLRDSDAYVRRAAARAAGTDPERKRHLIFSAGRITQIYV